MADIQTRLREAMRAEAEQASPDRLRPLRPLPEFTVRRRAAARTWLVPAAAAMAIVAVIALVTVGVHTATSRSGRTAGNSLSKLAGKLPVQPGRPAYLAAFGLELKPDGRPKNNTYVMVHDSVTGAVLSTVTLPPEDQRAPGDSLITAAGDDRHFVIEVGTGSQTNPVWRFWWLALSADGRHATLSPLTLPAGPHDMSVTGIALTADGGKLAVAWGTPPWMKQATGITSAMQVINLASGTSQTWTTRQGNVRFAVGTLTDLSWGTGDRTLGFRWSARWAGSLREGYYVLDTGDPGAGLLARQIINGWTGGRTLGWGYLAGPAQSVIAAVNFPVPGKSAVGGEGDPAIVEFSARTGRIVRTLYGPGTFEYGLDWYVFSIDPSGQHVLVGTPSMARIDNGVLTPLHLSAPVNNLADDGVWW